MSVYFHAYFNLNRERLSGVLNDLIEKPKSSEEQIALKFGYKAPFTKRYKSWLKKCGIIENSPKVKLTEYGKVIYKNDPKLKKEPTLLYMHSFLTNSEENAEVWNYFYYTFLTQNESFTKSELSEALSMKLMPHNPNHFRKNSPMIKVITKVLIDSYISKTAFGSLGIVELKDNIYLRRKTKTPYNWTNTESFTSLY